MCRLNNEHNIAMTTFLNFRKGDDVIAIEAATDLNDWV